MARRHPETALALPRSRADRLAACLVGAMVFLAGLAFAGGIAVSDFAARWQQGAGALLLVQVPDPAATSPAGGTRLQATLEMLRELPGVARAAAVPAARLAAMLAPWLGPGTEDLPLPALVEVTRAGGGPDSSALEVGLQQAAPGALAEDQEVYVAPLLAFAHGLTVLAGSIAILVGLVAATVVAFATHATLAAQLPAVTLLHSLGATERWIAQAFARRAARLALYGSVVGAFASLPVLAGLAALSAPLSGGLAGLVATPGLWLPAMLLPGLSWALARVSARFTVRRWLAQLW